MTSLILVEDHDVLRGELQYYLSKAGFDVRAVAGGEALNAALHQRQADILVLDWHMVGEDGISIVKRIRTNSPEIGIVMLTARASSIDREIGYQSGADVYMTKPAQPKEITAAIRNLSGRLKPKPTPPPSWVLDEDQMTLCDAMNVPIDITASDAKLLKMLATSGAGVRLA